MRPFILTTWSFGPVGNDAAFPALAKGGSALDAVCHAATVIEDDPAIDSVGVGGLPDADGEVSLDGAVITDPGRAGAVCFIRHYANPVQIARRVMEKTIHITLAGAGAEEFAEREGFHKRILLTDNARRVWEQWRKDPRNIDRDKYKGWLPPLNVEELRAAGVAETLDVTTRPTTGPKSGAAAASPASTSQLPHPHDTVGVLARDTSGRIAAACSTSGMAFKVPGRVGDSPIIGQGLYCDQQAGCAVATGTGELIAGVCGSFLVVELMRRGATPQQAVTETLTRIRDRYRLAPEHQVAFIAMNNKGDWTSGALRPGFFHTITDEAGSKVEPPRVLLLDR